MLSTDSKIFESEAPKIHNKLEKLQQQLDGLERDARLSGKRVADQVEAVDALRALVPAHVRDSVQADVNAIKSTLGRQIPDAATRTQELQCCLVPSKYRGENSYIAMLQGSFRAAVSVGDINRIRVRKLSPAWPEIRLEIEDELVELQSKLPEQQAEYDAAIAAARAPLNYYAD